MPFINRDMALGAQWLYGGKGAAAQKLGISRSTFDMLRAARGRQISDESQHRIDAKWKAMAPDSRMAIRDGYQLVEAMSPRQRDLIQRKGYMGQRRFVRAVKAWKKRRPKLPLDIGDFIAEVGSP